MKKPMHTAIILMLALGLTACSSSANENNSEKNSSVALTPSITQEELQNEVDFDSAEFITAEDGEVVVGSGKAKPSSNTENPASSAVRSELTPEQMREDEDFDFCADDFTLPEAVQMKDGSLGQLAIPKIGLTVSVYETDDEMEAMVNGVAHFKETSCWDGNIGLAGHNQGVNTYFGKIHTLTVGDKITLTTALGTRTYEVTELVEIDETDWSYLERTEDNRITLITCVNHDLSKRLCVQAVEVI